MSHDDVLVENVQSLIRQWCEDDPQFTEILEIGQEWNLESAFPVTESSNCKKVKLMIGMNYQPDRVDGVQPCINKLKSIFILLLEDVFGFSPEAALEFWQDSVVIVDRCTFILGYLDVRANKALYNILLEETDDLWKEVLSRVFTKKRFPNMQALITFGGSAFDYIDNFPVATTQTRAIVHPQKIENKFADEEQREIFIDVLTRILSGVTGVEPRGQLALVKKNTIFPVSKVTAAERVAKGVLTRARDMAVLYAIRGLIDSTSQLKVNVKSMNYEECADLLITKMELEKAKEKRVRAEAREKRKLAKAEEERLKAESRAKRKLEKARATEEARAKKMADIAISESGAALGRLDSSEESVNTFMKSIRPRKGI